MIRSRTLNLITSATFMYVYICLCTLSFANPTSSTTTVMVSSGSHNTDTVAPEGPPSHTDRDSYTCKYSRGAIYCGATARRILQLEKISTIKRAACMSRGNDSEFESCAFDSPICGQKVSGLRPTSFKTCHDPKDITKQDAPDSRSICINYFFFNLYIPIIFVRFMGSKVHTAPLSISCFGHFRSHTGHLLRGYI